MFMDTEYKQNKIQPKRLAVQKFLAAATRSEERDHCEQERQGGKKAKSKRGERERGRRRQSTCKRDQETEQNRERAR